MDPLFMIADAVVADLLIAKPTFGVDCDIERNYTPTWDLENESEADNRKPKVYVSAIVDDGEDDSRGQYKHESVIQILVGAYTAGDRGHNDVVVQLAADITRRYRPITDAPKRKLTYDTNKTATILNAVRPLVYDIEQLRAFGVLMSAINVTIRFDEPI